MSSFEAVKELQSTTVQLCGWLLPVLFLTIGKT